LPPPRVDAAQKGRSQCDDRAEVLDMATVEIQIVPVGTMTTSIGEYLADAVEVAKEKGIEPKVGPTGTTLEGDVPRLLDAAAPRRPAARRARTGAPLNPGPHRVGRTRGRAARRDKQLSAREKVRSVEARVEKR